MTVAVNVDLTVPVWVILCAGVYAAYHLVIMRHELTSLKREAEELKEIMFDITKKKDD